MSQILLRAPQLGEGITELKVTKIYKHPGETVASDEVILSVETDKAMVDIESPSDGVINSILCKEGEKIVIGKLLLKIDNMENADCSPSAKNKSTEPAFLTLVTDRNNASTVGLSPRIIGYCRRNNIDVSELQDIEGTGENGRIRLQDVISFYNHLPSSQTVAGYVASLSPACLKDQIANEVDQSDHTHQKLTFSTSQKQLNIAMMRSLSMPQASVSISYQLPDDYLVTLITAIAQLSTKFDKLRAEYINEETLHIHDVCRIGCAVALSGDNMATPVIEASSHTTREDVTRFILNDVMPLRRSKDIPQTTRKHSITISDMSGFGIEEATPFVVSPAIATFFIGTPKQDSGLSNLTLSFDHRVMNGVYAARILKYIKRTFEEIIL